MKTKILMLLAVLALVSCGSCSSAQGGIVFQGTDSISEAVALAAKEGKMVFVDVYAVWCGPCKMLNSKIFSDKKVGDYMNKNFVNVKVDGERGEGPSVVRNYRVQGYPTLLILDGAGTEVGRIVGAPGSADEFLAAVKEQVSARK